MPDVEYAVWAQPEAEHHRLARSECITMFVENVLRRERKSHADHDSGSLHRVMVAVLKTNGKERAVEVLPVVH